ncbi:nuclear transport factor 2 family protein [Mycobacterium sp. LTG2003]
MTGSGPIPEPVSEADRIAAAQAYIDALATHQADAVPFAPGCIRIEMGLKTGRSGDHLRRSLNNGPQFKLIERVTPAEFTVDGDHIRARFDVLTKPRLFGRRVCSHVDETFLIPASDGKIHHIHATLKPFISR